MTANPHRGEVEITLVGRRFVMRPSFAAIVEIEERTGEGIVALALRLGENRLKLTDLVAVITAGLKAAGEPARHDKVGEMVFETGLGALTGPVGEFLIAAVSGGRPPGGSRGGGDGPERHDIRRLRGFALAELGWSEPDFWAATPHALFDALDLRSGAFRREDFARFRAAVEGA